MSTLQTADGRLLRATRPAGANFTTGSGFFPNSFPPMWSNGEREGDDAWLKSYEAIYRTQPVVAAVVDKLARRIATLPFLAYRALGDGQRQADTGSSLSTLITKPMPRWGTVHLLIHVAQSLLIHGNAVVAKVRTTADPDLPPDRLWPLDWSRMSAYGQPGGTIEWWSTSQFDNVERFIAAEDTVHFAWPAPDGGEIGISPLEKLGVTIRLDDAIQRHQTAMFRNGSRPSLAVALEDPRPSKEVLEAARAGVEAVHKGPDNSGRTIFMGANVKLEKLSLSPVEVELLEQRKLNREEVGMVYDMAGPLMNDLEHGTYSNVSELQKGLYRDVVPPWTSLIVETFQAQLIDPESAWLDKTVRFDFTDKLRGDPTEQAQVDSSDVNVGIRTRDEAREGRGLPPMGGNAAVLTTNAVSNQAPVDAMASTPPETPSPTPPATPAQQ